MQRAAAHQVQHAARRAHDQRGAVVELLGLLADRLAAVDGDDVDVPPLGQLDALVADLDGQFAGRHQHQRLRRRGLAVRLQLLEDGDGEGGRLAGAGLGLAHHVHPGQRAGNHPRLHGRGLKICRPSSDSSMIGDSPMSAKLPAARGCCSAAGSAAAGGSVFRSNRGGVLTKLAL